MKELTTIQIEKKTRERLKRFQLRESARKAKRLTLSESIDALLEIGESVRED
jgi:hypothetical protein